MIKSTLGPLNITLADVAYNGKLVRDGLADIQTYLAHYPQRQLEKLSISQEKFLIEKHITQVSNALTLLQMNVDLLLDSVLHAQAGKVQQHLVSPKLLL